jgi:hypothetical protein
MIAPGDIHLLPPGANSAAAVRAAVRFEQLVVDHRFHEIIVLWYRVDPSNPFAVVLRVPKRRIQEAGWPLQVDPDVRVVEIKPAVNDKPPPDPPRFRWDQPEAKSGV